MTEEERDRLKAKEQRKNPGAILNNALSQIYTGAPTRGCLVNFISVLTIVLFIILVRACSS